MSAEQYTTVDGKTLHRWTTDDGQAWACVEYDHGPFCRRCVQVTPTMDIMLGLVADGLATVRPLPADRPADDLEFSLTDEGNRQAVHIINRVSNDA